MSEKKSPKKTSPKDWHRADIVAELRKADWSLRRLAKHHGYSAETTLITALNRPWPKGEALIAKAIGKPPETIWPARYAQRTAKHNTLQGVEQRTKTQNSQAA